MTTINGIFGQVVSWYRVFTLDGRCLDEGQPIECTHHPHLLAQSKELAQRCAESFYYSPIGITPHGSQHPWPLKIILLQGEDMQLVEVGSFVVSMALMPMFTAAPLEEAREVQS